MCVLALAAARGWSPANSQHLHTNSAASLSAHVCTTYHPACIIRWMLGMSRVPVACKE
jgi:hypothetical protein